MTIQEHLLPDQNSVPIQALAPDDSTHVQGTIDTAASSLVIPSGARVIEISVGLDCHVKFGAASQSAATTSDRFLPKGSYIYSLLGTHREVSFIRAAGASGTAPISVTRMV